jgi:hypothetical protein
MVAVGIIVRVRVMKGERGKERDGAYGIHF